ncbi:MAG TPA: asparagine synthase (glutamine-hydrolyzing) [Nitrosomonas sp.]|nr:asparagine synthase (glutamine-hydrolyzing) [Nitrosomonas sp.]HQX12697.1 asparagine synthase (glutamine-hydrolyzing) [Nitrosomonas sp.]HRB32304.1 asparagine synthase (glutamine-hydrolyzing) [Nitrosomonas sp.]HRB44966.1 asparagine synthase (glutamine-hydrolyzing) [Nitrosomonas sp.]HRB77237.1 asparagine synthase (glutamine-hydrolyzing) [Nitrosomonas sp.]
MCGIAGTLGGSLSPNDFGKILEQAGNTIAHRGPDDMGIWFDKETAIGFVHRRLSIIDLSPAGHQPMLSVTGRFVIIFNGEIYNHLDLRNELEKSDNAPRWRGHSDTESLLAAFECWGIEATLKKTVGMFAIALWDKKERKLFLMRDRMGEKPMYYGYFDDRLLFGSELKALRQLPGFKSEINRDVLSLLFRHNYIPAPYSIYTNVFKLMPGSFIEFSSETLRLRQRPEPKIYWSATEIALDAVKNPIKFSSDNEAINALESKLIQSISGQMMSDVPLGAFLSGGIDSSTIVALMQRQSSSAIKTFSIGFKEEDYDEAVFAREVAKHLGTSHTELYVSPDDAMNVIPKLPAIFDEPFSDSSQIPTFLVSELVKKHVTVSLSGDGGDELFCGYSRYLQYPKLWEKISVMPLFLRKIIGNIISSVSPENWNNLYDSISSLLPDKYQLLSLGNKLHKGASFLSCKDPAHFYRARMMHWEPKGLVLNASEPSTELSTFVSNELLSLKELMMLLDTIGYLPGDILTKVDRSAMAVSLETRVPLIDHRVYEFAWQLPMHYKVRNGISKWLLRQVLYKHVPQKLIDRPKMGFGVPIDSWLRGPLRDWSESLLDEARLKREGFLNPVPIRQKWLEHSTGKGNWQYHLWDILMFQAWLETVS